MSEGWSERRGGHGPGASLPRSCWQRGAQLQVQGGAWTGRAGPALLGLGEGVERSQELKALTPRGQGETMFAGLPKRWKAFPQQTQC